MLSGDLSVLIMKQLLIEAIDSGGWGPVDIRLVKIFLLATSHLMNKQGTEMACYEVCNLEGNVPNSFLSKR